MPSITKKIASTFKKRNNALKNKFEIDEIAYMTKHENVLCAEISYIANQYIKATIQFAEQIINLQKTGLYDVIVKLELFDTYTNSPWVIANGTTKTIVLKSGIKRRLVKHLDEATILVDAVFINKHINTVQASTGRIL